MGTTYIALLRGINVGGKNIIKMEALRQCFVDMGFTDVETYIQSGNIIFGSNMTDKSELTKAVETQLLKTFSAEIRTLILTVDELQGIVSQAPANFGVEPDNYRYDVWFLFPSITADEILPTVRLREGVDTMLAKGNALYTTRLTAEMNKSFLSRIIGMPVYHHITIRNWNTTTRLLGLALRGMKN